MPLTYQELVNEVLKDFNEATLDTTTEFDNAIGFHNVVKRYVNSAITDVYAYHDFAWPFAHTSTTQTLTVPTVQPFVTEYSFPDDCVKPDWNSFYIQRDGTQSDEQQFLEYIPQDQYRKDERDSDVNRETTSFEVPEFVVELPNRKWTVSSIPDKPYIVVYEYFKYPTKLVAATDTHEVPDAFEQVIIDRTLHYAYMFRDNMEQATLATNRFEDLMHVMNRALIPLSQHARYE